MMNFELANCKKNISFYKYQMKRSYKNRRFYAKEIVFMQRKLNLIFENLKIKN